MAIVTLDACTDHSQYKGHHSEACPILNRPLHAQLHAAAKLHTITMVAPKRRLQTHLARFVGVTSMIP